MSPVVNRHDVIIIGGGSAGNNTALRLAGLGYDVCVLDGREALGNKLCTGIVGTACASLYSVERSLVYREATSATMCSPNGRPIRFARQEAQAYVVDRVSYVAGIAERAQQAGAGYLLGHRVTNIHPGDDQVIVSSVRDSQRECHSAKAVVIASGFGTALTRSLDLGALPDYVAGVQAEVETPEDAEVEVYLGSQVAPGFFAWLVPTAPGKALVGLLTRQHAASYLQKLLARLRAEGKLNAPASEPKQWGLPLRPLPKTYSHRVLVLGDAAGLVKPTTGGGIFYSLVTSDLAADTLHQALQQNDLSETQLGAYETSWRGLLQRELDVGYAARRLFERLGDGQLNFLLRAVAGSGLHHDLLTLPTAAFDWHSGAVARLLTHPLVGGFLRLVQPFGSRIPEAADPTGPLEGLARGWRAT